MSLIRNDLDYVFPFGVDAGSAPNDELILGHKYGLNLWGYNSGVQVTGLTDTSFTFKSLYGHLEGAGKNIEFSFCLMDNGDTRFTVHAWGKNGFREWIPFERRANRLFAHILWGSMAANLKHNIAAGDWG